jgi:hypothetical protein
MRVHFISRLALLVMAAFGVVATQVFATHLWTGEDLELMFVIGGGVAIVVAAVDAIADDIVQRALDGLIGVLGAWTIIEALKFTGSELKWWSFGSACALAALSVIGLVVNEMTTERVVHELSVNGSQRASEEARAPATARS